MQTKVNLTFTGHLRNGFEFDRVADSLTTVWKIDRPQIVSQLRAGKPIILKKNLDQDSADLFRQRLEALGLEIRLEPVDGDLPPSPWESADPDEAPLPTTPGVHPASEGISETANFYAPPKADLKVDKTPPGDWLDKPRRVPASHGWTWIKTGTAMFMAHPWKWIGMGTLTGIIIFVISLIPFAGTILNPILGTLLGGGMALAAQGQETSGTLAIGTLFKGFTHHRNRLILMGCLYLLGSILILLIMALFVGKAIIPMLGIGGEDPQAVAAAVEKRLPIIILAWIIGFALFVPWVMSIWFGTIMVAISDQKIFKSIKLSFMGCLKNFLPFLVHGITFLVLFILVMIVTSLLSGLLIFLFGSSGSSGPSFIILFFPMFIMFLVMIPLMAVMGLSIYKSFRDIFYSAP